MSTRPILDDCPRVWGLGGRRGLKTDAVHRYLLEHGLKADGRLDPEATDNGEPGSFETFFTETGNGKYVPRSIFVDLDPSVRGERIGFIVDADALDRSPSMRSVRVLTVSSSIPNS